MANSESKESILSSILVIAFFSLWVSGVVHSYKKHSKIDFLISFFPPWGCYRGVESFFHKSPPLSPVTIRKENQKEVLALMIAMPENVEDKDRVNKSLTKMGDKISKYDNEEVNYLKDAANMYIRFHKNLGEDMKSLISNLYTTYGSADISNWDSRCKPIMDSLISTYGVMDMRREYNQLQSDVTTIKEGVIREGVNEGDKEKMLNELQVVQEGDQIRIGNAYKIMFREHSPYIGY